MKQPLLFTLLSSAACVATAADKAPKQTTPEKQNTQRCVYLCRRSRLWRFGMLRS